MDIEQIARTCHSVHAAYMLQFNRSTIAWEFADGAHRETVRDSVTKIIHGEIRSAEEAHDNFVERKLADGWTYAETYSTELKTSPRLRLFGLLSAQEQAVDHIFFAVVKSFVK